MTTTRGYSSKKKGFTLAEVMVALTLMSFLMAGLVSTFVFMLRSSVSLGNYADMNRDGSFFLEKFGRDIRMASDVASISDTSFIIIVDSASGLETLEYRFQSASSQLVRYSLSTGEQDVMLDNVGGLSIDYYNILGAETVNRNEVKAIQLRVDLTRKNLKNDNTDHIISARFNMRNRIITN